MIKYTIYTVMKDIQKLISNLQYSYPPYNNSSQLLSASKAHEKLDAFDPFKDIRLHVLI